jgi:hypothetical protein
VIVFFVAKIRKISPSLNVCTFLAHLAKGNVSFCHHLASVVRRFFLEINQSETRLACGGHVC